MNFTSSCLDYLLSRVLRPTLSVFCDLCPYSMIILGQGNCDISENYLLFQSTNTFWATVPLKEELLINSALNKLKIVIKSEIIVMKIESQYKKLQFLTLIILWVILVIGYKYFECISIVFQSICKFTRVCVTSVESYFWRCFWATLNG